MNKIISFFFTNRGGGGGGGVRLSSDTHDPICHQIRKETFGFPQRNPMSKSLKANAGTFKPRLDKGIILQITRIYGSP